MKTIVPNYYKKFKCIANKCKHNCCIGWEIDIDDATYERYENIHTNFGKKLNDNIATNDDCAYFKLTDNDRCPFLNKNNLCEIILNLGEESLCQICSDHPRFKNFYGDRVEIGLGLTCEEATRIIINENTKFELIEIDETKEIGVVYNDETEFFNIRNEIFKIIECEDSFESAIEKLLDKFNIKTPKKSVFYWADIYLKLERLDNIWSEMLEKIKSTDDIHFKLPCTYEKELKNLLIYFIYRHLGESVYDGNFNGRLLFAIISCYMISTLCRIGYNIEDVARMYSSEIEYSDENLSTLIELLQNESLEI
ncbi:MAG: hypothetical protein E7528_02445 [Ruminococcaceae bacterium]|nr:hypothetical protein [Oscillospiraceae bacterium]